MKGRPNNTCNLNWSIHWSLGKTGKPEANIQGSERQSDERSQNDLLKSASHKNNGLKMHEAGYLNVVYQIPCYMYPHYFNVIENINHFSRQLQNHICLWIQNYTCTCTSCIETAWYNTFKLLNIMIITINNNWAQPNDS